MKCVVLPSIPTSAFAEVSEVVLRVRRVTLNDIAEASKNCDVIINYIRHPPTNKLLSEIMDFAVGTEYKISANDVIFIVGLKSRAPVSGQDVPVTVNDLLILAVDILSIS
jgi:intergrase/recombinase